MELNDNEFKEYWKNINEKTNSIIEILRGVSYQEIEQILEAVKENTNLRLKKSIVF